MACELVATYTEFMSHAVQRRHSQLPQRTWWAIQLINQNGTQRRRQGSSGWDLGEE